MLTHKIENICIAAMSRSLHFSESGHLFQQNWTLKSNKKFEKTKNWYSQNYGVRGKTIPKYAYGKHFTFQITFLRMETFALSFFN